MHAYSKGSEKKYEHFSEWHPRKCILCCVCVMLYVCWLGVMYNNGFTSLLFSLVSWYSTIVQYRDILDIAVLWWVICNNANTQWHMYRKVCSNYSGIYGEQLHSPNSALPDLSPPSTQKFQDVWSDADSVGRSNTDFISNRNSKNMLRKVRYVVSSN